MQVEVEELQTFDLLLGKAIENAAVLIPLQLPVGGGLVRGWWGGDGGGLMAVAVAATPVVAAVRQLSRFHGLVDQP